MSNTHKPKYPVPEHGEILYWEPVENEDHETNRLTPKQLVEAKEIASELVCLHERIMRLGLLKTGHAMHDGPIQQIGYEIAEKMPVSEYAESMHD